MSDYALVEDELEAMESPGDYEIDDELAMLLEADDEARRRGRQRRPVPTGKGAGYYRQRPSTQYVTQVQLQAALEKISKDVKANAAGLKTVGSRVDTVAADQKKHAEVLKKESTDRRREIARMKSNAQMSAILPLVMQRSITVGSADTIGGTTIPAGTKLSVAPDPLAALLPMFLTSGNGSSNSSGGDNSGMLLMALALGGGL
jgi:hypothetical protein